MEVPDDGVYESTDSNKVVAFDERIRRLKEEISFEREAVGGQHTPAEEFDGVYNLPDDYVPPEYFPEEEVSE